MKNLKNQKGITLVALVVTIIVLLILAGVSLSLVAGSNGIMTRTVNARDKNEIATARERGELALAEKQMEWYEEYYANATIRDSLQDYLKGKKILSGDYTVEINAEGTTATVLITRGSNAPAPIVVGNLSYTGNGLTVSNWAEATATTAP